jgi:hypothetical protein
MFGTLIGRSFNFSKLDIEIMQKIRGLKNIPVLLGPERTVDAIVENPVELDDNGIYCGWVSGFPRGEKLLKREWWPHGQDGSSG